jgi:hypothetical protein
MKGKDLSQWEDKEILPLVGEKDNGDKDSCATKYSKLVGQVGKEARESSRKTATSDTRGTIKNISLYAQLTVHCT